MCTPLHHASRKGYTDVVMLLIDRGADVNAENGWGETPLHEASYDGHTDAMKLLEAHGAI